MDKRNSILSIFNLGAMASLEEITTWTRQQLDPTAVGTRMVGARLLVLRDKAPETYSRSPSDPDAPKIFIPDTVQNRNPPGSGVVIAAGALCGQGFATYPGELSFDPSYEAPNARDFLGLRVYFEMYAGTAFRSSLRDSEWKAELLILLTKDVISVDVLNSPKWVNNK